MSSHTDQTIFVQFFGSILAHVGNIRSKLFQTSLSITHLKRILINMNRSKYIFSNKFLRDYNRILKVVSFPGHKCHFQVTSQCEFPFLSRVSFCQNLTRFNTIALFDKGLHVYSGTLVGFLIFDKFVSFRFRLKTHKLLFISKIISQYNLCSIHILHNTVSFGHNLCTGITYQFTFKASSYNRSFRTQQRNCLTHHVRSHQSTVGIIMLKERNQRCSN